MKTKLSGLEAFRYLEIKTKDSSWELVNQDAFIGPATVMVDAGLISEVTVTLMDRGVPADQEIGGIEYPRMNPSNMGTMRCRFSFGYVEMPASTKQLYEGFLKEMRPQFPGGGQPPRVELVFQCAGWEFTRVRRKQSYPHIAKKQVPEEQETKEETEYIIDPEDRSWAERPDVTDEILLEDIIRNIITSYGYPVEIKLPDDEIRISGESPLKQSQETDWQFLRRLGENYGFNFYSDVVKENIEDTDEITNIFKWFVVPDTDIRKTQQNDQVKFWYHQPRGELVEHYDPSAGSDFVIQGEPDITVNSNWAFQPRVIEETEEDGEQVYKLTDVDENLEIVVYTINQDMLDTEEATEYADAYLQGEATWDEAKKFFIREAIDQGTVERKGRNRSQYQGVELSFSTAGNPLAEIGMSYPILGLGAFYSKNFALMSMTHTISHKWETSYNFKIMS